MRLDKLNQDIDRFRTHSENSSFKTFDEPGEYFFKRELEYKKELAYHFQEFANRLISGNYDQYFEDLLTLLTKQKLGSFQMVQNLISFYDYGKLKTVIEQSTENRLGFAERLRVLLIAADDDEAIWPTIDEFIAWLREHGLHTAGATKIWPTLFLFLWRPDKFIFIKPRFFDQILAVYGLEVLGKGIPLDSTRYRRVMHDMEELKNLLRPLGETDYIGVQSFLWYVYNLKEEDSQFSNIWLIQSSQNVLSQKAKKLFLSWELAGSDEQIELYHDYIDCFEKGDLIVFVDPQNRNTTLGEVRVDSAAVQSSVLNISASKLWKHRVTVSTELNEQFIAAGVVENHDFREERCMSFCREYLDVGRWNFLIEWNSEHISSITDTSNTASPAHELRFVDGDRAKLRWGSTHGTVGDPIYFLSTTSEQPGIIAKARICVTTTIGDDVLIEFEDAPTKSGDAPLSQARLEAQLETHRWKPGRTIQSGKRELKSTLRSLWSNALRTPINAIYYGPPGTGKTYLLRDKCLSNYTGSTKTVVREEHLRETLASLKWREVIAATLHELGPPRTARFDLVNHEYIKIKSILNDVNPLKIVHIIRSMLRIHTSDLCTNVRQKQKHDPEWFWLNDDRTWRFADDFDPDETGITHYLQELQKSSDSGSSQFKRYAFVTFHQSYSYEEFVEGIRPSLDQDSQEVAYELRHGIFREICEKARKDPTGAPYALFIDEINRGNISKIFGELITLIEEDKREGARNELEVTLPYSKDRFTVPRNLDIYGSMNTADRSLVPIDNALRRRFTFYELMPRPKLLSSIMFKEVELNLCLLLTAMNERIEALFDRDHMIGHAYFLSGNGMSISADELPDVFRYRIIPLLTEYFFDDWTKVRQVLADEGASEDLQFVHEHSTNTLSKSPVYRLNPKALDNPEAYKKIYR